MPKFNKQVFFSALAVVLLAVAVCFRFFGEVILHPGEFLFGPSGDGLKNYFSVAYQVIHGDGLWFNGMLYPYGDHIMFADGQPLLTRALQFFIEPDVNNGPKVIAIMNLLMIGSLVITAWCVHRLLVWNYVNPWFAVPFALTIAFLSPQVARFTGHYALGYTCFVPISWLLIAGFSRTKWPWPMAILASAVTLAFGFLHPYYLFIFVIFLGSIVGWELIVQRFQPANIAQLLPRLFAIAVPLLVFLVYQHLADPYTDRPTSPGGLFFYNASLVSVFTPVVDPFRELFHSYFFRIFKLTDWEGNAYVGMVASFTVLTSAFAMLRRFFKRGLRVLTHPVLPPVLKTVLVPSVLTLLFAMGVFHKWGLEWLSEFISPLKQFRSVGRVAWIFYYVCSVWVAYHLYVLFRYLRSIQKGKLVYHAYVLTLLCVFMWMLDSVVNIKYHKANMLNRNAVESFSDRYVSEWVSAGVNVQDHQAILPMPLQLIGSEKIGLSKGNKSLLYAMKGSFSSGLPIIGGAMSRTSLGVTEKTAQLAADSLFPRPILQDLKPDLKLLLIQSDEPLTREEHRMVSLAEKVYETDDFKLLSISVEDLKHLYSRRFTVPDSVVSENSHYIEPLDFERTEDSLWGAPIYRMNSGDRIIDTTFGQADTLNISYWVRVDPKEKLLPCRIFAVDRTWLLAGGIGEDPNIMDGWLHVSEDLPMTADAHHRYMMDARPGLISRFQLRRKNELVIHREPSGKTFINNIPVQ